MAFAENIDWFGLSGDILAVKSSSENAGRSVVEAVECVKVCAFEAPSGHLVNPSVTYCVKQAGDFTFALGKAYNVDGKTFMIVRVEIATEMGKPPSVTVSAVANEGVDACALLENQISATTVSISARFKALDVAGAFSGDRASLTRCVTTWSADPVVVMDVVSGILMPVASDVVRPRCEVSATTSGSPIGGIDNAFTDRKRDNPNRGDTLYPTYDYDFVKFI